MGISDQAGRLIGGVKDSADLHAAYIVNNLGTASVLAPHMAERPTAGLQPPQPKDLRPSPRASLPGDSDADGLRLPNGEASKSSRGTVPAMGSYAVQLVLTPDGRELEVRDTGPEDGFPPVFHHSTPGAAVRLGILERPAAARGLPVIAYSRPRRGRSTPRTDADTTATVADDAIDTATILDKEVLTAFLEQQVAPLRSATDDLIAMWPTERGSDPRSGP